MKNYSNEVDGQLAFYGDYLPLVDRNLNLDEIYMDYNDGIVNGSILEFKLIINDVSATLFQAIKYLSARRIKGKPIPKNILLVSLNEDLVYVFDSEDYIDDIEKVYMGGASKNTVGFSHLSANEILNLTKDLEQQRLIRLLKTDNYTKVNIDENNIVGWATSYYEQKPDARKSDFIGDKTGKIKIIGEIRRPTLFKDYIHPYTGKDNVRFRYLMDQLNEDLRKKNLGTFYTPIEYANLSHELLKKAIERVPEGNDYIILDRCAGTGNLEYHLPDEILSHVIVSTVEYYEYKVLLELLGDKVRYIVPPVEKEDTFNAGLVKDADALSEEYINNEVIMQYVNDPKCNVILFENPPYAETTSIEHQKQGAGKNASGWKNSYVVSEMRKEVKGTALNDLANPFIWSAFKYYLLKPEDSYLVYSPAKYWKAQHLIDKEFLGGYGFNRRHFHTRINAFVMCTLWGAKDATINEFELDSYDIDNEGNLIPVGKVPIKRIHSTYSRIFFDKRKFPNDTEDGILCSLDGTERTKQTSIRIKPLYNENIIGYMAVYSSGFDNPDLHASLLRAGRYDGNGFFLRDDNFLEKLPMFGASRYITYNREWTERARVMKSADGSDRYFADVKSGKIEQELLKILLFTTLEPQNHMRSLHGSDGRLYVNQLCLDNSNGETLANSGLKKLKKNENEKMLINQWKLLLDAAKKTTNYNPEYTYGLYQIDRELNTFQEVVEGRKKIRLYDYPQLNGYIRSLKQMVKEYYLGEIVPFLFEYEFLK